MNIPLCSDECDGWFEACKDDYTCSDNWGETWKWSKKGNECKLPCKRFKDYYKDPVSFCNKIFNHSFEYTDGEHGKDCMSLWPDSDVRDLNRELACKVALTLVSAGISLNALVFANIGFIVYAALFLQKLLDL
jgi:folate receptor